MLLKGKIKFLESENNILKTDMNIKQKVIGSILEHTSNLLNHQCCQVSENANNEIYQKSSEYKENKLVVEITPTLLIGSKMINVDKDQDEVIDKKNS